MHFFGFRFNEKWPIWLAPALIIGFLACFLHLLDRQSELTSRSDFLWQYKLSSEEEGVDTMRGINKILLENILPAHVAEHYLHRVQGISSTLQDSNVSLVVFLLVCIQFCFRRLLYTTSIIHYHFYVSIFIVKNILFSSLFQELYSERYENIAVMFASIPNYKEFYDENDVNKQGLECLRLLNEIICDFDKVCVYVNIYILSR